MFIIFGFGKRTVKLLGKTEKRHCQNCHNFRGWECKKITKWFTMFFIPLIPYKVDYIVECPICHFSQKIDKNDLENYISIQLVDEDEDTTLTDVQRNYRKEMERNKRA